MKPRRGSRNSFGRRVRGRQSQLLIVGNRRPRFALSSGNRQRLRSDSKNSNGAGAAAVAESCGSEAFSRIAKRVSVLYADTSAYGIISYGLSFRNPLAFRAARNCSCDFVPFIELQALQSSCRLSR